MRAIDILREIGEARSNMKGLSLYRFDMYDPKAEVFARKLRAFGYEPDFSAPFKGRKRMTDMFFIISNYNVKELGKMQGMRGLNNYRVSMGWQGFGAGSLEDIEYKIVLPKRTGQSKWVQYRGTYMVYTPEGDFAVEVEGKVQPESYDENSIAEAVTEDIGYFLDENPELYTPEYDDEETEEEDYYEEPEEEEDVFGLGEPSKEMADKKLNTDWLFGENRAKRLLENLR